MTPEMIRAEYPEILSSEQIRQILGISKRKASWMLNNGHIPCQITDQPTHRYKILREDLIALTTKVVIIAATIASGTPFTKITGSIAEYRSPSALPWARLYALPKNKYIIFITRIVFVREPQIPAKIHASDVLEVNFFKILYT